MNVPQFSNKNNKIYLNWFFYDIYIVDLELTSQDIQQINPF